MKNFVKTNILAVIVSFGATSALVHAQQEPQFSQFMDNQLYINPAYAGSRDALSIGGIHRQQWIGYSGAPMSSGIFIHSPLKYESVGIGGSVINDRIGPLNQTWINLDFSYTLRFKNSDSRLSFGLKGGMNLVNGRFSELHTTTASDPTMMQNYSNRAMPNFGFGMMYQGTKFFAGVSVPKILNHGNLSTWNTMLEQRHYYVLAGATFDLGTNWKFRPATLVKMTDNAPLAWDFNFAFVANEKWWFGVNYRLIESVGGFVQLQVSERFKIGYSFDVSTTAMVRYNYGSHELLLRYELPRKNAVNFSPRYF